MVGPVEALDGRGVCVARRNKPLADLAAGRIGGGADPGVGAPMVKERADAEADPLPPLPSRVGILDVRPESLPDRIGAHARSLWQRVSSWPHCRCCTGARCRA